MKRLLFGFIAGMVLTPYLARTHAQDGGRIVISGTTTQGDAQIVTDCSVIYLTNPPTGCAVSLDTILRQIQEITDAQTAHRGHDLTVRDLVEILADYEIRHADQQPFFQPAYGVTNFDSSPPAVWIFNASDTPSRRSTVIHELLHVYYHQRGTDLTEEFIRSEEDRQYKALFGGAE